VVNPTKMAASIAVRNGIVEYLKLFPKDMD